MGTKFIALVLAAVALPASAGGTFSCEQIKEKAVRASCIADRDAAKKAKDTGDQAEVEKEKKISVATNSIREALNDPESARFRKLFVSPKGRAVCGEVNAKNKMGGYVGFRRFIVADDQSGIEGDDSSFVEANWQGRCINDVRYDSADLAK